MRYFSSLFFLLFSFSVFSQSKFNIYNPNADAQEEIVLAVEKAQLNKKHVFIQIGGNWCGWCKLFHDLVTSDSDLSDFIAKNYEVVHVNYDSQNTNEEVLLNLEFPQRFGFPVFVILDANGRRIHTQNSGYLEEGKGHSKAKVLEFLQHWAPASIAAETYKK